MYKSTRARKVAVNNANNVLGYELQGDRRMADASDPHVRVDYGAHASVAAEEFTERLLRKSLGRRRRRDAVAEALELRDVERG